MADFDTDNPLGALSSDDVAAIDALFEGLYIDEFTVDNPAYGETYVSYGQSINQDDYLTMAAFWLPALPLYLILLQPLGVARRISGFSNWLNMKG